MKLLADQHISPRTVEFLRALGHDAVRVSERLSPHATDRAILALAASEGRVILTQDLDFTGLVATSAGAPASLIVLRLASPRVERVNEVLRSVLPSIEEMVRSGAIVTVEDSRIRIRSLPIK